MTKKMVSALLFMTAGIIHVASATITVDGYFRLGENDPGAAAGQPGQNPTRDVTETKALAIGAGSPTNSALVASSALLHTGSTLSMLFNGSSYYATNVALNANTDNYGIEAWFSPLSTSGSQIIAANGTAGGGTAGYELWLSGGQIRGLKYPASYILSDITATVGQWYHVGFVVSNGVGTLYVNGIAAATNGSMAAGVPSGNFSIGSEAAGGNPFNGYVDEVRVFHFDPGEFQVTDLLYHPSVVDTPYTDGILADDPVAYYRMNETEGSGLFDMATNVAQQGSQDGVYRKSLDKTWTSLVPTNGPSPDAFPGFEAGNTAPYFNDALLDNAYTVMPAMGTNYSIELWINSALAMDQFVLGYMMGRGISTAWDVLGICGTYDGAPFPSSQGKLIAFNNAGQGFSGATVLAPNTWYHAVMVRSNTTVTLYLNGNAEASGTMSASAGTNTEFWIGRRPDNFTYFRGWLDETAIYDRALSAGDVLAHYNWALYEPPSGTVISIR
ncbi:MAG: LamG domain-containing protein [Lentisphaerae bacterium]|nr:LamG domain-containing protein [Lentisphaerota bacterium]